jgi:hypothetical protein
MIAFMDISIIDCGFAKRTQDDNWRLKLRNHMDRIGEVKETIDAPYFRYVDQHCIIPMMRTAVARVFMLVTMAFAIGGCSSVNTWLASAMADHIPKWAGGPPEDAPPRPGTAAYDEYAKKLEGASTPAVPQHNEAPQPAEHH